MLLTRSLWRRPREKTLPLANILGKKITCTKSLKGRIIEFSKVFCFVFHFNFRSGQNKVDMCVEGDKFVFFLGGALFLFLSKMESEEPGLFPQVEIEVARRTVAPMSARCDRLRNKGRWNQNDPAVTSHITSAWQRDSFSACRLALQPEYEMPAFENERRARKQART